MANDLGIGIMFGLKDMFSGKARTVTRNMRDMDKGATKVSTKFNKLEASMNAVAGAAIFELSRRALTGITRPFLEFEQKMAEVSTLVDGGAEGLGDLNDQLLKMSTSFGISAIDQAQAAYDGLSSGVINASNASELLTVANKAAIAGVADLGQTIGLVGSIINAYGMDAKDAEHVSDVLFQTVKKGTTELPALGASMRRVTGISAGLGISIEDLGAVIATLTNKMGKGSTPEAMTAIKAALVGLNKPSDELAEIWKTLGFESAEALIKQKGVATALKAVSLWTGNSTEKLIDLLGSAEAANAVLQLMGDSGAMLTERLKDMQKAAGATEDAFGDVSKSFSFRAGKMRETFNKIKITLGRRLLEAIEPVVEKFAVLITKFDEWLDRNPWMAKAISLLIAGLAGLGVVLGLVTLAAGALALILSPIGIVILKIVAIVAAIVVAFKVWSAIIDEVTGEQDFLLNKAIAGWNALVNFAKDFIVVFKHDIMPILRVAYDMVVAMLQNMKSFFGAIFSFIGGAIKGVASFFDGLIRKILTLLEKLPFVGDEISEIRKSYEKFSDEFQKKDFSMSDMFGKLNFIGNRADDIRLQEAKTKAALREPQVADMSMVQNPNMSLAEPQIIENIINPPEVKIAAADVVMDHKKLMQIFFEQMKNSSLRDTKQM